MSSTTYAIAAASLPALQGPGAARLIGGASTDPATAFGFSPIGSGETSGFSRKDAKKALGLDYALRVGSPGYGIIEGLGFSDDGAITLTVATGKSHIDGEIELSEATDVTLADGTNYIYHKRDKTLEVITGSLTPPVLPANRIGTVIVAAGAVVNYDLSGVIYHKGIPRRKTGDAYMPADTPGVTWMFISEGTNATYLWDGVAYRYLAPANAHNIAQSAYAAITGTVALAATDPNVIVMKNTSGGDQKVLLPQYGAWGASFRIRNHKDSTHSVLVRDSADTTTIATLTAGQVQTFEPDDDTAGTPIFPIA
jgi:hypothetical protein